jgi:bacterial/archaeal transporter family protein
VNPSWQLWAVLSATFAALTAIFAKVGRRGCQRGFRNLHQDGGHRACAGAMLLGAGQWQSPGSIAGRSYPFLVLSGLATGASWLCYFRALRLGDAAAPIDKLSVAIFGVAFLCETLSWPNWLGIALIGAGAGLVAW